MIRKCVLVFRLFSKSRLFAAMMVCMLCLGSSVYGQSAGMPHVINFSGTLPSQDGARTVDALFALYSEQSGGAPLWQELQNVAVDASGQYAALLGSATPGGIPADGVFSGNEARWFGVQVLGEAEQPRVLLASVPYAVKAGDSDGLGGLPASAFLRNDGSPVARLLTLGPGLTGSLSDNLLTLASDTTVVQQRVTGSCPSGSAIASIGPAGQVSCEAVSGTVAQTGIAPTSSQTVSAIAGQTIAPAAVNAQSLNGVANPLMYPGADLCAQINAAAQALSSLHTIKIPAGNYTCANNIEALPYGVNLEGESSGAVKITLNGSGVGLDTAGFNVIRNLTLVCGTSVTDCVRLRGSVVTLDGFYISGGGASSKLVHIAAFNSSVLSGIVRVKNGQWRTYLGTALYIDHAIDVHLDDLEILNSGGATTPRAIVIDTSTSGVYAKKIVSNNSGAGALLVISSTTGSGEYNQTPKFLFFDQLIADMSSGGDAIKFDSTLGSNVLYAEFMNSWAAGAGMNGSLGVVSASANGLGIYGGTGIRWSGRLRSNANNGVYVNGANVAYLDITGFITGNNVANNADGHGVYIASASPGIRVHDCTAGNVIDTSGHQRYGVKVGAVAAAQFMLRDCQLTNNISGGYLIQDTAGFSARGNDSGGSGGSASGDYLNGPLQVIGSISGQGVNATVVSSTGGYQNKGVTIIPGTVTGYSGTDGTKVVLSTTPSPGHAACWTTTGRAGYCYTAIRIDGSCGCR